LLVHRAFVGKYFSVGEIADCAMSHYLFHGIRYDEAVVGVHSDRSVDRGEGTLVAALSGAETAGGAYGRRCCLVVQAQAIRINEVGGMFDLAAQRYGIATRRAGVTA
jgi:hypothetical protein